MTPKTKKSHQLEARVQNAVQRTEEQRRVAENLQDKLQLAQLQVQQQPATAPEAKDLAMREPKNCLAHAIFTSWMSTT